MNKAELIERLEWHAEHQRACHRSKEAAGWQGAAQVVRNCLDSDLPPSVMIKSELEAALRQYRHNDDTPDFVFAYETGRVDRLIERLIRGIERRCPINIVFDGPPSATAPRFIEVKNDNGESIRVGEWVERKDGLWTLRIT